MSEYVVQIRNDGWLALSFEVGPGKPIPSPEDIPPDCEQVILTNTTSYNAIVAVYNQYTTAAVFSYDEPGAKIDCSGPVTDSWPIN
jgi:hypothetical protein